MQEITPDKLASLIHERLVRLDLEQADSGHDDPVVGLTLYLKDEMPEHVFLNIRFELIVQVAESSAVQPDGSPVEPFQAIAFVVTEVLATLGSQPHYVLELQPMAKKRLLDPCHKTAFITLSDEARMHRRDWRKDVVSVRFCHARYPEARYESENPRAEPLRPRMYLPPHETPGNDEQDLRNLLTAADDAFSDPGETGHPSSGTHRTYPEFDLDEALRAGAG